MVILKSWEFGHAKSKNQKDTVNIFLGWIKSIDIFKKYRKVTQKKKKTAIKVTLWNTLRIARIKG